MYDLERFANTITGWTDNQIKEEAKLQAYMINHHDSKDAEMALSVVREELKRRGLYDEQCMREITKASF